MNYLNLWEATVIDILIGKYRNIVVSIALFLLLDASVLMLNFYISFEIADDAAGVNLAGRQRMLSQRMVKSTFDLDYALKQSLDPAPPREELRTTILLFDSTLNAFESGGNATAADGTPIYLEAASTPAAKTAIADANAIWGPYKQRLLNVVDADHTEMAPALAQAILYARDNNLTLLKLMNDLTIELESVASSKATRLRWIQTVGITLAVINFFIILFHFLRQLKESDRKVEQARQETVEILETVNEGLFLLDKEYVISSQYSRALEQMFARENLGGTSLQALLGDLISDKNLSTAKRFIALLFRDDIKSALIGDLNPLKQVEVNISSEQGKFVTKYFCFTFERAYDEGEIANILVTVLDITDRVVLERELALTREQNERQIEVLTSILHSDPRALESFVQQVFEAVERINRILREPSRSSVALQKKATDIFIEVHRIKGESSALGLESFEDMTHEFESVIHTIKEKPEPAGDDFLPLVVRLEKLYKHAESVQAMTVKLGQFSGKRLDKTDGAQPHLGWAELNALCSRIAERQGKKVGLVLQGALPVGLADAHDQLVRDFVLQTLRNAVSHGIERPEQRVPLGKPEAGRVQLSVTQNSASALEISVYDDGAGIDFEALKQKAVATGRFSKAQLDTWSEQKLSALLFEPGVTTSEHGLDAGGGVGLSMVREHVKTQGASVSIRSQKGKGTRFRLRLPVVESASAATVEEALGEALC